MSPSDTFQRHGSGEARRIVRRVLASLRAWLIALVAFFLPSLAAVGAPDHRGELIVFVSSGASPIAASFSHGALPAIRRVAEAENVRLRIADVAVGAPPEVTITPLLVYQDHRGRSIYQGRYTNTRRIRNFLRTARFIPMDDRRLTMRGAAVWSPGRARVAAPVKVAPLSGHSPSGLDQDRFRADARRAVMQGFRKFRASRSVELRRSDRRFYMDVNPWMSADGTLFVSLALFSQFHCKKPIFTQPGEALTGAWGDRARLFRRAGERLERAVMRAVSDSDGGDGFDPVSKALSVVSWESLDLALPAAPAAAGSVAVRPKLARRWRLEPGSSADATLTFHFPAPLDGYAGEVGHVSGEITLGPGLTLVGARGGFRADPASVTMGDPDLDHTLYSDTYLDVKTHPVSRFDIKAVESDADPLAYGSLTRATLRGTFSMKGVSIPLSVAVFFEPVVDEAGSPVLVMSGGFSIRLAPFQLEGPDGPAPAKDTLTFDLHFALTPAAD